MPCHPDISRASHFPPRGACQSFPYRPTLNSSTIPRPPLLPVQPRKSRLRTLHKHCYRRGKQIFIYPMRVSVEKRRYCYRRVFHSPLVVFLGA